MSDLAQAGLLMALLFLLLGLGVWVALALIACGIAGLVFFTSAPAGLLFANTIWGSTAGWALTALPLFIWMGEILFRTRLAEDMFAGLGPWLNKLPGRLVHVNVLGCGIFAAVSGSSAATAATIGKISLPELKARGYDDSLAIGSLAGAGTLGLLIPPSIVMIVYGVAAQVSIVKLFTAGILPGLMLMALFSIYTGVATATEAALGGSLTRSSFVASLMGAVRTSCMITSMGLSAYALLAVLTVFFVLLGCFLDGIYLILVVEMAQIMPPVGFNLFVIQGITGKNL